MRKVFFCRFPICVLALTLILTIIGITPLSAAELNAERAMEILSGGTGWIDGTPLIQQSRTAGVDSILSGVSKGFERPLRKALAPPTNMDFWILDLTDYGSPSFDLNEEKYLTSATLRQTTSTAYLYIEDGITVSTDLVNQLMAAWDSDIYPNVTGIWGPPPDELDGDPRVYLLIARFKEAILSGGTVVGFFDNANEYTDAEAMSLGLGHSNEIEMLYVNSDAVYSDAFGNLDETVLGILAHEFQHVIHWGLDPDEDLWLNEGNSDLAMIASGHDDILQDHTLSFAMIPTTGLLNWDNRLEDYGATAYFFLYLNEHYGGDAAITAIANDTINGVTAVDTYLRVNYGTNFRKVFRDWTLANLLDEPSGPYGYTSTDNPKEWVDLLDGIGFPPPYFYTWRDVPLDEPSPPPLPYLENWGAEYFLLTRQPGETGQNFYIAFDAENGKPFFPDVVGLQAASTTRTSLNQLVLDNDYAGDFDIPVSEDRVCVVLRHASADLASATGDYGDYDLRSLSGFGTEVTDSAAPAQVTDLAVDAVDGTRVYLSWTTPGDDGLAGTAFYYDIRASTSGPINDGNWASAFPVRNVPLPGPSSQTQSFVVLDLAPGQDHWFAMKTYDEVDNGSLLSNSPMAHTGPPDTTAPRQILDLVVAEKLPNSIVLQWTAPGDDGSTGTATRYELRLAQFAIDDTNFRDAFLYPQIQAPSPAGTLEAVVIPKSLFGIGWSFTIRTFDEENNVSAFSNVVYEDAATGVDIWDKVYR